MNKVLVLHYNAFTINCTADDVHNLQEGLKRQDKTIHTCITLQGFLKLAKTVRVSMVLVKNTFCSVATLRYGYLSSLPVYRLTFHNKHTCALLILYM